MIFFCERRSDHAFLGIVRKPSAVDLPPRVRLGKSSPKFSAIGERDGMVSPRSNEGNVGDPIPELIVPIFASKRQSLSTDVEYRREGHNVVVPEDWFQFRKVSFGKVRPCIHGTIIHAANFKRQRVRLRRYQKIGAQAPKFLRQSVAHVQRYAQRRRGYSHTESERRSGEELVARTASKRIGNNS